MCVVEGNARVVDKMGRSQCGDTGEKKIGGMVRLRSTITPSITTASRDMSVNSGLWEQRRYFLGYHCLCRNNNLFGDVRAIVWRGNKATRDPSCGNANGIIGSHAEGINKTATVWRSTKGQDVGGQRLSEEVMSPSYNLKSTASVQAPVSR